MTELAIYAIFAIAFLVLAAWLVRETSAHDEGEIDAEKDLAQGLWDGPSLNLAYRIFDPADYKWLHDELWFPVAARALASHRKQLAIQWLKGLRNSFKELVRLPEDAALEGGLGTGDSSWQLLWLTLRFQFLLSYALLVVRLFGPYHRLVPYLGWLHSVREYGFRKPRYGEVGGGRIT